GDPRARLNLGIRRRLAPLLENDFDKIKLMNSLLLSMPGSPIIYYGDEIGMGDNVYLGDRDGVRTPMQWGPDRNAGFSTVDPQRRQSGTVGTAGRARSRDVQGPRAGGVDGTHAVPAGRRVALFADVTRAWLPLVQAHAKSRNSRVARGAAAARRGPRSRALRR